MFLSICIHLMFGFHLAQAEPVRSGNVQSDLISATVPASSTASELQAYRTPSSPTNHGQHSAIASITTLWHGKLLETTVPEASPPLRIPSSLKFSSSWVLPSQAVNTSPPQLASEYGGSSKYPHPPESMSTAANIVESKSGVTESTNAGQATSHGPPKSERHPSSRTPPTSTLGSTTPITRLNAVQTRESGAYPDTVSSSSAPGPLTRSLVDETSDLVSYDPPTVTLPSDSWRASAYPVDGPKTTSQSTFPTIDFASRSMSSAMGYQTTDSSAGSFSAESFTSNNTQMRQSNALSPVMASSTAISSAIGSVTAGTIMSSSTASRASSAESSTTTLLQEAAISTSNSSVNMWSPTSPWVSGAAWSDTASTSTSTDFSTVYLSYRKFLASSTKSKWAFSTVHTADSLHTTSALAGFATNTGVESTPSRAPVYSVTSQSPVNSTVDPTIGIPKISAPSVSVNRLPNIMTGSTAAFTSAVQAPSTSTADFPADSPMGIPLRFPVTNRTDSVTSFLATLSSLVSSTSIATTRRKPPALKSSADSPTSKHAADATVRPSAHSRGSSSSTTIAPSLATHDTSCSAETSVTKSHITQSERRPPPTSAQGVIPPSPSVYASAQTEPHKAGSSRSDQQHPSTMEASTFATSIRSTGKTEGSRKTAATTKDCI